MTIIEFIKNATEFNTFDTYEALYMGLRAIIIYFIGVTISRSNKKIMDIHTPFNFMLFVMLGSIFAQAILIKKMFLQVLCAISTLIFVNYIMKKLSFHFPIIERFVKGSRVFLIENGEINWDEMSSHGITKRELLNELASQLHTYDLTRVERVILGSDGTMNFVLKSKKN